MNPFDMHIATEESPPPHDDVPYYIIAKDGWMTNMPTLFGIAQTAMKDSAPPTIAEVKTTFNLNDRKVPERLLGQAHSFFRAVWDKHKTESSLFIIYNRETDSFGLWAPEQYATRTSVNHRLLTTPKGWLSVGTIHSHCDFGAFHSGTDTHDMAGMPGLHITIGHVDRDDPEYAIAMSMGQTKFDVPKENIIEAGAEEQVKHPSHWMGFVKTGPAPWTNGTTVNYAKYVPKQNNWTPARTPIRPAMTTPQKSQYEGFDSGFDYYEEVANDSYYRQIGAFDDEPNTSDEPFDKFSEEIADAQYSLESIGDMLEEIGFCIDWSVYWNPKKASERSKVLNYADIA